MSRRSSVTRVSSVVVRIKDKADIPPKKLILPNTMDSLKKTAEKVFQLEKPILSVYDNNGVLITKISDIIPGSTLLLSDRPSVEHESKLPVRKKGAEKLFPDIPVQEEEIEIQQEDGSDMETDSETEMEIDNANEGDVVQALIEEEVPEEQVTDEEREEGKFEELLGEVFPESGLEDTVRELIASLPADYRNLLENAVEIEQKQKSHWIKALKRLIPESERKQLEIVQKHTFGTSCGYVHRINLVIGGPTGSGKSYLLKSIANSFVDAMAACDTWKRTFVMYFDADKLSCDAKTLYLEMVTMTLDFLVAQRPLLKEHRTLLQKYFDKVIDTGHLPLLPKRFTEHEETRTTAEVCQRIALSIVESMQNPSHFGTWINNVVGLPLMMFKGLGFSDSLFFIDHMDSANVDIDPGDLFQEAQPVNLGHSLKSMLEFGNFVVSYKSLNRFNDLMGGDLIETLSVLDTYADETVPYQDQEIIVQTAGDPIRIRAEHFGTSPGLIKKWTTANEIFDKLSACEEDSEDWENFLAVALGEIQGLLPMIFHLEDKIEVYDVRRRQLS